MLDLTSAIVQYTTQEINVKMVFVAPPPPHEFNTLLIFIYTSMQLNAILAVKMVAIVLPLMSALALMDGLDRSVLKVTLYYSS